MKIKNNLIYLFFFSFYFSFSLQLKALELPDVIYGVDRRQDVLTLPLDSPLKDFSRSVGGLVYLNQLSPYASTETGLIQVEGQSLWDKIKICADEPFAKELSVARCSAFLLSEDIAVTAGHCLLTQNDCNKTAIIFDLTSDLPKKGKMTLVRNEKIYTCEKVLDKGYLHQKDYDYTLFRLNRKVYDRAYLKLHEGPDEMNPESLLAIGFPMGVPLKIDLKASIVPLQEGESDMASYVFRTDLDMFKGNSGSPIISKNSGEVVGMQIRGAEDFIFDPVSQCKRSHVCHNIGVDEDCDGELALKSQLILTAMRLQSSINF